MTTKDALDRPKLGEPFLLTPGPLTTSAAVKEAMLRDWGSWDGDFRAMTASMRTALLELLGKGAEDYDCVPMQGSGTFAVEAMLASFTRKDRKDADPEQRCLWQARRRDHDLSRPPGRTARQG